MPRKIKSQSEITATIDFESGRKWTNARALCLWNSRVAQKRPMGVPRARAAIERGNDRLVYSLSAKETVAESKGGGDKSTPEITVGIYWSKE